MRSSTEPPRIAAIEMRYFRTNPEVAARRRFAGRRQILCRGQRFQGEAQNPRFDSAHRRSHGVPHLARGIRFADNNFSGNDLELHRRCAGCQTKSSRVGAEEEKRPSQ